MKKKHLVMLVGGYYPNPSATGKCAEQYISLIQDEYEVDVICIASLGMPLEGEYNGKNIHRISCKYHTWQNHLQLKEKMNLYKISKIPIHIANRFRHPNNLYWYIDAAYNQLEAIHSDKPIDFVFSVAAPTAAHCAAKKFKELHPNIRWVAYTVDSYAAQNKNKKRFTDFEKSLLRKADYNFLSEEIYQNSSFLYQGGEERFERLPYRLPDIKIATKASCFFDHTKINVVYAGSFYRKIRNPRFALDVFRCMPDDIVLHLYCTSDCDDIINEIVRNSGGKIIRHATVDSDTILKIYSSADILLNVGNSLPEFKPSKTFDYIATGKPIINIYYPGCKDEVLEKYQLMLQVCNLSCKQDAVKQIESFISNIGEAKVDDDEIKALYRCHLSDEIRRKLLRVLERCN